jgi:hypothetical protein
MTKPEWKVDKLVYDGSKGVIEKYFPSAPGLEKLIQVFFRIYKHKL